MKSIFKLIGKKTEEGKPALYKVFSQSGKDMVENELLTRASSLAFTAMMAAIPFLALVITIAAHLLPDQNSQGATGLGQQIIGHLEILLGTVLPEEAALVVEEQVARLQSNPPVAILSFSLLITIWLASNLFATVIDALNRMYGVEEARPYLKMRLIAAFMTIVQSGILLIAISAIFVWPVVIETLGLTDEVSWYATLANWIIVFMMVLTSFSLTFLVGPNIKQRLQWFSPGSIFGAIAFIATTYGFRIYVQNFAQYDTMYGSLGGVMILMFWFWINSLVLLVSAQINKTFYYAHLLHNSLNS